MTYALPIIAYVQLKNIKVMENRLLDLTRIKRLSHFSRASINQIDIQAIFRVSKL